MSEPDSIITVHDSLTVETIETVDTIGLAVGELPVLPADSGNVITWREIPVVKNFTVSEVLAIKDSDTAFAAPRESAKIELAAMTTEEPVPDWHEGLAPIERPGHTGHNQGVVTLIVVLLLIVSLSFKNVKRVCGIMTKRLISATGHQNAEPTTINEKRAIVLLLIVTVFFIALIMTAGLSGALPTTFRFTFDAILKVSCLVGCYFLVQYGIYCVLGYTFTTEEGTRLWVESFTAMMTLLGIVLILPGIVVLFYPDAATAAIVVSALLYVMARIIFVCKGFRIFYTNLGFLVYFILYLCSLEIIPILLVYQIAISYCSYVV